MKDLVEIIAKSLVDHPEQIAVTETEEDGIIKIDLTVAPEDMGKVIRAESPNPSVQLSRQLLQRVIRRLSLILSRTA